MEKSEIFEFVRKMKPNDHVVLLYTEPEDKHRVLFEYLKAGLDAGEAAAYIAGGEEGPEQIKRAMQKFGIDVKRHEKSGALKVIDYKTWYIINGKFDKSKTLTSWKELLDESTSKGFKGLRVTGETDCFFRHKMIAELADYELSLHRILDIPMTAICTYNQQVIGKLGGSEATMLLIDILRAHSTAIIMGPSVGLVKTVES